MLQKELKLDQNKFGGITIIFVDGKLSLEQKYKW